ncbi:MAG: hypothetical protein LBD71_07125 [Treponema sp.]|jgi:hypothetical protein|nr:hypothetical protein [Treponema sp.]
MRNKKIAGLFFALGAALALFLSCTGFFSTSLASWAQRDPAGLLPALTAANVNDLVKKTANDPALSLELLKKIKNTVNSVSGGEKALLQAAALNAAANAAAPVKAVQKYIDGDTEVNKNNAADLFNKITGELKNRAETAETLKGILPAAAVPGNPEFDAFVNAADPYYLALAAAILFADDAVKSGDSAGYMAAYTSPGASPLAEALTKAAFDKGGDTLGIAGDLLDNLHLN